MDQDEARAPYSGYYGTDLPSENKELTHVQPGTAAGEYLRRFWHAISLSSELKDLPLLVRILGEDLVLFRDLSGRLGLLHRHCAHRRASLEFGKLEERGIRCCYHGWLFDVDGTILETPGEPVSVSRFLRGYRYIMDSRHAENHPRRKSDRDTASEPAKMPTLSGPAMGVRRKRP